MGTLYQSALFYFFVVVVELASFIPEFVELKQLTGPVAGDPCGERLHTDPARCAYRLRRHPMHAYPALAQYDRSSMIDESLFVLQCVIRRLPSSSAGLLTGRTSRTDHHIYIYIYIYVSQINRTFLSSRRPCYYSCRTGDCNLTPAAPTYPRRRSNLPSRPWCPRSPAATAARAHRCSY